MGRDVRRYRLFNPPEAVRMYYETGGVGLDAYVTPSGGGHAVWAILPKVPGGPVVEVGRLGETASRRLVDCLRAGGNVDLVLLEASRLGEQPAWADVELRLATPGPDGDDGETFGVRSLVLALAALASVLFVGYEVWGLIDRWAGKGR